MIKLPQFVKIKWNSANKQYYEKKGYKYTKVKEQFEVNVLDLPINSRIKVNAICDYCGAEHITLFKIANPNKIVKYKSEHKICCKKCWFIKVKDVNTEKYGIDILSKLSSVKEKARNTSIEKYGAASPTLNKDIRNKVKQTCLQKYGVENCFQNEELKQKAHINRARSLYKNSTAPCSKQQRYLHKLFGGELNYPVGFCSLDIAFPDEKIYIEYDGSGHGYYYKYYNRNKEFEEKEKKRQYFLQNNGWKLIRIVSSKDILLDDNRFNELIKYCKTYLKSEHNWIIINIDNNKIKNSQSEINIDEV